MSLSSSRGFFALPARRLSAGFSLVEILLVLGLIATIAIAAFVIYPKVRVSREVSEASDKFNLIASTTKEFFNGRSYTGLTAAAAISAGVVEANDLNSPWGAISLAPTPSGTGFEVDYASVPQEACQQLLAALAPSTSALRVGTTYVKNTGATPAVNYSIPTALAACNASTQTISAWPAMD